MIDAPCADCSKDGRTRMGTHQEGNGDVTCNTHHLVRMRCPVSGDGADSEVLSALVNMGFARREAEKAVIEAQRSGAVGLEAITKSALQQLRGSAAGFLSDPEAIEKDHAARTGQTVQSVHRRAKPKAAVEDYVDRTVATSHGGADSHLDEDQEADREFGDEEEEPAGKAAGRAEGKKVVQNGRKKIDVDWAKVQEERTRGVSAETLAVKYKCHITSIYAHTKTGGKTQAARHAANATVAETRRPARTATETVMRSERARPVTGGNYESVLADLWNKRERLNTECKQVDAAIEALEGIA